MKVKTGHRVKKRVVPFLLAAAMTATTMPVYMTPSVIVKASEQEGFGTTHTNLEAGTYLVPVSLKKAADITQSSMADACVEKLAVLKIDENKKATLEIGLKSLNKMGATGNAANIKIFRGNNAEGSSDCL